MKFIVKIFLCFSIAFMYGVQAFGGEIIGKVLMLDSSTPHVSLVMQAIKDGKVLQTVLTDNNGEFKFTFNAPQSCVIRIHMLEFFVYYHKNLDYTLSEEQASVIDVGLNRILRMDDIFIPRFIKGNWTQYHPTDGLADTYCTCVYRDPRGNMWFGTEGGFSFFENGQLKSITMSNNLPNSWVNCIVSINEKEILIGTDEGLAKYNWQSKEMHVFPNEEVSGRYIGVLKKARNGNILVGAEDNVYIFNDSQFNKLLSLTNQVKQIDNLLNDKIVVNGLAEDKNGVLWVGAGIDMGTYMVHEDLIGGLFKFDGTVCTKWNLTGEKVIKDVKDLLYTKGNLLYVATNKGLFEIEPNGEHKFYGANEGLYDSSIFGLYESSDGAVWISSSRRDVTVSRLHDHNIVHLKSSFIKEGQAKNTRAVSSSIDGKIWIATAGNGLISYDNFGSIQYGIQDNLPSDTVLKVKATQENK
ncbi:TPA: hypothetical protein EYG59_15560, partial [Candidatus Poribacteria bacterium]|nr:hypothetical protein [Candidatus Poribacteria bacterium]